MRKIPRIAAADVARFTIQMTITNVMQMERTVSNSIPAETPELKRHTREECESYFVEWLDGIHKEEAKVEEQKRQYRICYQQFRNQK